jgi:hypothetical protein
MNASREGLRTAGGVRTLPFERRRQPRIAGIPRRSDNLRLLYIIGCGGKPHDACVSIVTVVGLVRSRAGDWENEMELSFACENSAEATVLAQELEGALRDQGISPDDVALKPASSENMDIGTVLWVMEKAAQTIEVAGTVHTIAKCVYAIANKYGVGVTVTKAEGKVEVPAAMVAMSVIEQVLSDSSKPRAALKS